MGSAEERGGGDLRSRALFAVPARSYTAGAASVRRNFSAAPSRSISPVPETRPGESGRSDEPGSARPAESRQMQSAFIREHCTPRVHRSPGAYRLSHQTRPVLDAPSSTLLHAGEPQVGEAAEHHSSTRTDTTFAIKKISRYICIHEYGTRVSSDELRRGIICFFLRRFQAPCPIPMDNASRRPLRMLRNLMNWDFCHCSLKLIFFFFSSKSLRQIC